MAEFTAHWNKQGVWPFTYFNRTQVVPPCNATPEEVKAGLAILDERTRPQTATTRSDGGSPTAHGVRSARRRSRPATGHRRPRMARGSRIDPVLRHREQLGRRTHARSAPADTRRRPSTTDRPAHRPIRQRRTPGLDAHELSRPHSRSRTRRRRQLRHRLYDYAHSGRNQLAWVVDRLRDDPRTRNATITTFQPLTDTRYIPCVSLLDFWINHGALQLAAYAHGIDFGTKGYANLIELAQIQHRIADELGTPVGALTFIIKSAHIYNTELDGMSAINGAP